MRLIWPSIAPSECAPSVQICYRVCVCVCVRIHSFHPCRARVWPPSVVPQVAEGAVHQAGGELPTGDEEGVKRHQLAPEVRRGGLSDVHRHRHAGDACGERETWGEEAISRRLLMGEEVAVLHNSCFLCCVKSFFSISFLNIQSFFFCKSMLIITQQLTNSNPETFSGDVTDCTNFYLFHFFQFNDSS